MSLDLAPNELDDTTHSKLDLAVFRTVDSEPSGILLATLLLATIVSTSSECHLNPKYAETPNARALLQEHPTLIEKLKQAWAKGTFREIRNLSILRATISPSSSNTSNRSDLSETCILSPASSSFTDLAERGQFVDKSSALCDFLKETTPVHLLLRPRRSGKTTLLRMFRAFFEYANPAELNQRNGVFIKNDLAITKSRKFETEFGRYPVLYIDLSNVIASTMPELLQKFRECIRDEVTQLEGSGCFKHRQELDRGSLQLLEGILDNSLPDSQWATVPYKLTRLLNTLTKRKAVVLVDEYDTPTSYAVNHGYFTEANQFFRSVFAPLLKNNEFLRGALVIGILQVAKAGWLSGANNIDVHTLGESATYSTACMFTEEETQKLYDRQNETYQATGEPLPFTFKQLRRWYNGYSTVNNIKLYNPWSVGMALNKRTLGSYWVKSGYDPAVQKRIAYMLNANDQFRVQLNDLLIGKAVKIRIEEGMSYHSVPEMSTSQLWTLIYYAGYLTKAQALHDNSSKSSDGESSDDESSDDESSDDESSDDGSYDDNDSSGPGSTLVHIPNYEIRSVFRRWLQGHVSRYMSTHSRVRSSSTRLFRTMISGTMSSFAQDFRRLVLQTMPGQFFGSKEVVYQAYVCTFFTAAANALDAGLQWEVEVERYARSGRLDLIIQQPGGAHASIHEYKRIRLSEKDKMGGYGKSQRVRLTKLSQEALEQIETKGYRIAIRDCVTELREFGVAFLGPYCAVVGRLLRRDDYTRPWEIKELYTTDVDEAGRAEVYDRPAGPS